MTSLGCCSTRSAGFSGSAMRSRNSCPAARPIATASTATVVKGRLPKSGFGHVGGAHHRAVVAGLQAQMTQTKHHPKREQVVEANHRTGWPFPPEQRDDSAKAVLP